MRVEEQGEVCEGRERGSGRGEGEGEGDTGITMTCKGTTLDDILPIGVRGLPSKMKKKLIARELSLDNDVLRQRS